MAIPNQGGSLSFSQLITELNRTPQTTFSLYAAENGAYGAINQCSYYRPSTASSYAALSEWFSYDHTAPCVYYYCLGYSNTSVTEACQGTVSCTPSIAVHDYVIIRFSWAATAGDDLDIVCGFINTGVSGVQDNTVGYGQGNDTVPDNTPVSTAYVFWNDDNTDSGVEALSVNFTKLLADYPSISDNPLRFRINAWWFQQRLDGIINLEFLAYSGGTPLVGTQFNMLPGLGSTISDYVKLTINVTATNTGGGATFNNTQTLGYINYNRTTKTATFTTT